MILSSDGHVIESEFEIILLINLIYDYFFK